MSGPRTIAVVVALMHLPLAAAGADRTWTDVTGKFSIKASFVRMDGEMIHLKKADGQTIRVPLDKLSEGDKEHLNRRQETWKRLSKRRVWTDKNERQLVATIKELHADSVLLEDMRGNVREFRFDSLSASDLQWLRETDPELDMGGPSDLGESDGTKEDTKTAKAPRSDSYSQSINDKTKILNDIDSSYESKLQALSALGAEGPAALPVIRKYLQHSNEGFRSVAVHTLGRIGEAAIPDLLDLLETKESSTALEYLGKMGPNAQSAVPRLFEYVHANNDKPVSVTAMRAIEKIGVGSDATYVPDLLEVLSRLDKTVPKQVASLSWLGVQSSRNTCCRAAVVLLGNIGPAAKDAVPRLCEMIRDGHNIRPTPHWPGAEGKGRAYDVITTLGKIGPDAKEAVPVLRKFLSPAPGVGISFGGSSTEMMRLAEDTIAKIKK